MSGAEITLLANPAGAIAATGLAAVCVATPSCRAAVSSAVTHIVNELRKLSVPNVELPQDWQTGNSKRAPEPGRNIGGRIALAAALLNELQRKETKFEDTARPFVGTKEAVKGSELIPPAYFPEHPEYRMYEQMRRRIATSGTPATVPVADVASQKILEFLEVLFATTSLPRDERVKFEVLATNYYRAFWRAYSLNSGIAGDRDFGIVHPLSYPVIAEVLDKSRNVDAPTFVVGGQGTGKTTAIINALNFLSPWRSSYFEVDRLQGAEEIKKQILPAMLSRFQTSGVTQNSSLLEALRAATSQSSSPIHLGIDELTFMRNRDALMFFLDLAVMKNVHLLFGVHPAFDGEPHLFLTSEMEPGTVYTRPIDPDLYFDHLSILFGGVAPSSLMSRATLESFLRITGLTPRQAEYFILPPTGDIPGSGRLKNTISDPLYPSLVFATKTLEAYRSYLNNEGVPLAFTRICRELTHYFELSLDFFMPRPTRDLLLRKIRANGKFRFEVTQEELEVLRPLIRAGKLRDVPNSSSQEVEVVGELFQEFLRHKYLSDQSLSR